MSNPHFPFPRLLLAALLLVGLSLALEATSVQAQANDYRGWRLRADLAYVDFSLDATGRTADGQPVPIDADSDLGYGLSAEYRFSRRFGVDFGFSHTSTRLNVRLPSSPVGPVRLGDSPGMTPLTVGIAWHLTPDSRVDLYLAGRLAWVTFGDVTLSQPQLGCQRFAAEDDWTASMALGAYIPLSNIPLRNHRWSLHVEAEKLDTKLELTNQADQATSILELDPLLLRVGVAYRF